MRADEVECLRRVYDAFCEAFGETDGPMRYFTGMGAYAAWLGGRPSIDAMPLEAMPMQMAHDAWIFRVIEREAWYPEWNKQKVLVALCKAMDETLPTDRNHLTR